jgi:hypothetical protein
MNMTNYYTSITQSSKIVHTRPFLKSSFDVKAKPPSDSKIICDHFNARARTFCKSWSKHLTCLDHHRLVPRLARIYLMHSSRKSPYERVS